MFTVESGRPSAPYLAAIRPLSIVQTARSVLAIGYSRLISVGIGNRVFEADFLFPVDGRLRGLDDFLIAHGGQFVQRTADPATGPLFAEEQTGQVNE